MSVKSTSGLLHHRNLIPPERMLAECCPSLSGKVLCGFLKGMDSIEWSFLRSEEKSLNLSNWEFHNDKRWYALAFGYTILPSFFGGWIGCSAKWLLMTSNPVSATIGVVSGFGITYLLSKNGAMNLQSLACVDVSLQRNCRLEEKQSLIEKQVKSLKNSWFFSYEKELEQLSIAMIHFSHGIRRI